MKEEAEDKYKLLFTSSHPTEFSEIVEGISTSVTTQRNEDLIKPFEDQEIKAVFLSVDTNRAAGPDGMTPTFFSKFWHIVGKDITEAIHSFFHSGFLLKSINETIISLIPKTDHPANVGQFRPITLYNVLYKTISKLLINRLKPI